MLYDGTATGKGLNITGKSATQGPLASQPFLQISEEAHKAQVGLSPLDARNHIFYRPRRYESRREGPWRSRRPECSRASLQRPGML